LKPNPVHSQTSRVPSAGLTLPASAGPCPAREACPEEPPERGSLAAGRAAWLSGWSAEGSLTPLGLNARSSSWGREPLPLPSCLPLPPLRSARAVRQPVPRTPPSEGGYRRSVPGDAHHTEPPCQGFTPLGQRHVRAQRQDRTGIPSQHGVKPRRASSAARALPGAAAEKGPAPGTRGVCPARSLCPCRVPKAEVPAALGTAGMPAAMPGTTANASSSAGHRRDASSSPGTAGMPAAMPGTAANASSSAGHRRDASSSPGTTGTLAAAPGTAVTPAAAAQGTAGHRSQCRQQCRAPQGHQQRRAPQGCRQHCRR